MQAQAVVLEKKVYAHRESSGDCACRYTLRVRFEDGATTALTYRAFGETVASARVGDVIPMRYDLADRSKIEIDRQAIATQNKARERELEAEAVARGEAALERSSSRTIAVAAADEPRPQAGDLRIGDADRELIASMLSEHMVEGRLTPEELDERLEALYTSRTREQARAVLAELPPLALAGRALPDWLTDPVPVAPRSPQATQTHRQSSAGAGAVPTDEEMATAYAHWREKVSKVKADKAAHKRAEATGEKKETFIAFRTLAISRAEE